MPIVVLDPVLPVPTTAFSLDDRHRSLRRFAINALGAPPWTLRTERQQVKDEQRPVGVVEAVSAVVVTAARVSIPQGDVDKAQSFAFALYPALGSTAAASRLAAAEVAQQFEDAIVNGLVDDTGALLTGPMRIPVYDFSAVPVTGKTRVGPSESYGWLWVEDAPVRTVQDPDDLLRWAVTCTMRVSWREGGRVADADPTIATSVPGTGVWVGSGEL